MTNAEQIDFAYHWTGPTKAATSNDRLSPPFRTACYVHALSVQDALIHSFVALQPLAGRMRNADAANFVLHGVGRRMGTMLASLRGMLAKNLTERTEPLSLDAAKEVSRDLNSIYLDIIGILDNYAWCLLHELASAESKDHARRVPQGVGLFNRRFLSDVALHALAADLSAFRGWVDEVKTRRDPAAHRIPLYLPTTALNEADLQVYEDLQDKMNRAFERADMDEAERLQEEQGRLGTFAPCFQHHPDEEVMPIFPTVPQDIANMLKIDRVVRDFLVSGEGSHP